MRRPPGMADARRRLRKGVRTEEALQIGELAGLLADLQVITADDGDPRGVVPAVLEPAQARNHDLQGLLLPHITHDPAHKGEPIGAHLLPAEGRPRSPAAG